EDRGRAVVVMSSIARWKDASASSGSRTADDPRRFGRGQARRRPRARTAPGGEAALPITKSTRGMLAPQTAPGEGAEILARLAEESHLQEGAEGVRTVLRAIVAITPATTQGIARACRLPVPVVAALRREMEHAGLLRRGHGMELTEAGRDLIDTLGLGAAWE